MLTIKFPDYPTARAIIIDEPINGVSGIVECTKCAWKAVLLGVETEKLSDEIENFIKFHPCQVAPRESKQALLDEIIKRHKAYQF